MATIYNEKYNTNTNTHKYKYHQIQIQTQIRQRAAGSQPITAICEKEDVWSGGNARVAMASRAQATLALNVAIRRSPVQNTI